jgi:hypothetical protein
MRPTRPQTVKELVAQAENFSFNMNIPFKHWIRAAETLYQEVCTFLIPHDMSANLFRLLLRFQTAISVELT